MSQELAIDVAILLPPEARARAVALSAALPQFESDGLRLDDTRLPHVTLTQAFVRVEELDAAFERVDEVLRAQPPLVVEIIGASRNKHTLSLAVERHPKLVTLHEQLMEALRGYERPGGTPAAFVDGAGRVSDVMWVTGYRLKSAFHSYIPHITLGHGKETPPVDPFGFEATTIAACHLGRFCTCRRVLRAWELVRPA
jgi:2'-5' RNA ligase